MIDQPVFHEVQGVYAEVFISGPQARLKLAHLVDEGVMLFLVRLKSPIAGLLHEPFFGGKVRTRILQKSGKHRPDRLLALSLAHGLVQLIEKLDQSLVLGVHLGYADAQAFVPCDKRHAESPRVLAAMIHSSASRQT
jgi:hypothetical protein